MENIIDLAHARGQKVAAGEEICRQILAFAESTQFPGEQYIDQITQLPTLDAEAETELRRVFGLFGITKLDPLSQDFDLVGNTWYELTRVGSGLRSRKTARCSRERAE